MAIAKGGGDGWPAASRGVKGHNMVTPRWGHQACQQQGIKIDKPGENDKFCALIVLAMGWKWAA